MVKGSAQKAEPDEEAFFRQRVREFVEAKYGSLDRFQSETGFSKGHLSQILSGKRSPSLSTIVRLARALGIRVADFFISEPRAIR
jgi:transcriptional regulator with XRE-family HTH domain